MFEPWMLGAIDQAGYNGIRDEQRNAVAREVLGSGLTDVSRSDFNRACHRCGIDSNNFTQRDLELLQELLNK